MERWMHRESVHHPLLKQGDLVVVWDSQFKEWVAGIVSNDVGEKHIYVGIRELDDSYTSMWDLETVTRAVWSFVGPVPCPG